MAVSGRDDAGKLALAFVEIGALSEAYELMRRFRRSPNSIATAPIAKIPSTNLKNQWGWAGSATRDLASCRLMARFTALIYNWRSLFMRLAEPGKHLEAITSRPLLLTAIAERNSRRPPDTLKVASSHARRPHFLGGAKPFVMYEAKSDIMRLRRSSSIEVVKRSRKEMKKDCPTTIRLAAAKSASGRMR